VDIMDTIIARLDRAREHLKVLDDALKEFLVSHPYTYTSKFKPKRDNIYDWVFTVHGHREIPLRMSAIFGDGIQNVRTALDYLIYQLSTTHAGNYCDLKGVAFPIFSDPDRYMAIDGGIQRTKGRVWTSSGLYKIRNITPSAQTIIESLQPYHGGDNVLLGQIQ
jgi:hypothetical protein